MGVLFIVQNYQRQPVQQAIRGKITQSKKSIRGQTAVVKAEDKS